MSNSVFLDRFAKFCISSDANVLASGCSVLVEGQYIVNGALACPVVPDKPVLIQSDRYVDDMFGAGSVLALMIKTMFKCGQGKLSITALPRQDASGSTAAEYTLTFAGPSTSAGTLMLFLGEAQWNVRIPVALAATATTIATAVFNAIAALPSFPYTATNPSAGVVRLVAKNKGTVGNHLTPIMNWSGLVDLMPCGITLTTARAVTGAGNPTVINYADALGTCCYKCYALGTDDPVWQEGLRAFLDTRWDCTKPQCFGHGFTYNVGTLGGVLATWDNQATLSSMARPANPRTLPYLDLANQVALRCASACENPELSIQGPDEGNLRCVRSPMSCSTEWTESEMEALQDRGFTVLIPAVGGVGGLTSQYVRADTTRYVYDEQNRRNLTWRDVNARYLDAALAERWGKYLQKYNGMAIATKNTEIKVGRRATNINLVTADIIAYFKTEVGFTISEFDDINQDIVVRTDEQVKGQCVGQPGVIYVSVQFQRMNRIVGFYGDIVPKMWDNCDRSAAA